MRHHIPSIFVILILVSSSLTGQELSLFDTILPNEKIDLASRFGESIVVENDIAVIGMPHSGEYGYRAGQAFVYQRKDNAWSRIAELRSPSPHLNAYFGSEVAISGDIIVISSPNQNGTVSGEGALFVYEKIGVEWDLHDHIATLTSSEPQTNAGLGESIAFDDNVIIASSPNFDTLNVKDAGRVLVFEKPIGGWGNMNQTANLYSSIPTSFGSQFGYDVEIRGDTIAVGANYSNVGDAINGIVFLYYNNSGSSWESGSEAAYLKGQEGFDYQFGRDIILTKDRLFIASRTSGENFNGPPFVYVYGGETAYSLLASLSPSDYILNNSPPMVSLHYDGTSIYHGVNNYSPDGMSKGAVFRYDEPAAGWQSANSDETYVSETEFFSIESFGSALAGNETDLLIGNPGNARNGVSGGAVHVVDKASASETSLLSEVTMNAHYHRFGSRISVSGEYALVYKHTFSPHGALGSVDVLKKESTTWTRIGEIAPDEHTITSFASDFDIQGTTIVISALKENRQGVVRIYEIVGGTIDVDQYEELEASFDGDLENFGIHLSLDAYSLVIGGYEVIDRQKESAKLFVFEKENLTSTAYEQSAILTYAFETTFNQFFKGIHHNRDRIVFTLTDAGYPSIINFEKEGPSWENASIRIIANPESSLSETNYNRFGTTGHLNDNLFITHDAWGTNHLYTFDLEPEQVEAPLSVSSTSQSFGTNFRGSGSLGLSGNAIGSLNPISDQAIAFGIQEDGSLDSLFAVNNPGTDTASNFGRAFDLYGTNVLISAQSEDNDNGYFAGAIYAYATNQPYVTEATSGQSGLFGPGENIQMMLTFNEPVDVVGFPFFNLNLEEGEEGIAVYQSGTGTDQLIFNYSITGGDNSLILDYLEHDLKMPAGASIRSVGSGEQVNLVLPPVGSGKSISGSTIITVEASVPKVTFNNTKTQFNGAFDLPVSFNKEVTGFEVADLVTTNAIVHEITGSGASYILNVEPLQPGVFSLYLAEGAVSDQYDQMNDQSEELQLVFETIAPEYIIATNSFPSASNIVEVTFQSTEEASVLTDGLELDNLFVISYTQQSTSHTIKFLIQERTKTASCTLSSGSLVDEAGNFNTQSHTLTFFSDTEPPVISVPNPPIYLKSVENVLPISLNEEIGLLVFSKIEVNNADYALAETSSSREYQLLLTPTGSSLITVTFLEGTFFDLSGNPSTQTQYQFLYDNDPPEVSYILNEVGVDYVKVFMKITEPVNEISTSDFTTEGIDSLGLKKYVDGNYLLYIRPDQTSNVTLSLKPEQIFDVAGNFMVFSEFNHVVTSIGHESAAYDLRWNDLNNELSVHLSRPSRIATLSIYDTMGKRLYHSSTFSRSKALTLNELPSIFMVVLSVDGSVYSSKLSNK
ncbi:MAG: FG-GAP repeat protein [Ekhidna sp.]